MEKIERINLSWIWKRPSSVPFPQIWDRFEAFKNGKTYKFRIEDVTLDRHEEVVQIMTERYFRDEPCCSSTNLLSDQLSVMAYQHLFRKYLQNNMTIVVVLDEDIPNPEIVGIHLRVVQSKQDPPFPNVPGEKMKTLVQLLEDLRKNVDPFQVFQSDTYIYGCGLLVKSEYRGLHLCDKILSNIKDVAQAFDIKGALISFSNERAQISAKKLGFEVYNEIFYDQYKDQEGRIIFPIEGMKSATCTGIKYI